MSEVNKSGQVLGQKGQQTRSRLIAATKSLIEESRGLVPSAAAVARAAGISQPTFYLYLADVGEAILEVVEQIGDDLEPLIALLDADWAAGELFDRVRAFVSAYFAYWEAHASALRVRNRLADQGDERFVTLRLKSVGRLSAAIARKLASPEVNGRVVTDRDSIAAVLVTALERTATVLVLDLYPDGHLRPATSIDALALLITRTMEPVRL